MNELERAATAAMELLTSRRWGTTPYMDMQVYDDAADVAAKLKVALIGITQQVEPVDEPVAWIPRNQLEKARIEPFLCRVEPTQRRPDFVALYTAPPKQAEPVVGPVVDERNIN